MKRIVFIAAVVAAAGSTAIAGEQGHDHARPIFSEVDVNGDALISSDEFASFVEQKRKDMAERRARRPGGFDPVAMGDDDGDGYLNEPEFQRLMERMMERRSRFFGRDRSSDDG